MKYANLFILFCYLCSMILHSLPISHPEDKPTQMNNPFDYVPHPLCRVACQELQHELSQRLDWKEEIDRGKMFGILLVEHPDGIGYLAAYSGQIGGRSDWDGFVPAVYDYLQPDGYFKTHEAEITHINHAIAQLEKDERMQNAQQIINTLNQTRQQTIANYQAQMKEAKARRDARRQEALQAEEGKGLTAEEEQAMIKESQFMKAELRRLKKTLSKKTPLEIEYTDYQENITRLKQLRKQLSDALQQWLFSQFRMLNPKGESKDLLEIFRDAALKEAPQASMLSKRIAFKMVPPAGSGECCEPKLLQYAYAQGYRPLQMAMFWWGESPKEEIRHHLHFYPACQGKCKPILQWMLPELSSPQMGNETSKVPIYNKVENAPELETLYEDREITVVCKPAGMLSVPGKREAPSVYSLMHKKYPEATGPLIVHRLDMATSGLMVIAKTEFAYHRLQTQFVNHRVKKRYIAIVGKCCQGRKGNESQEEIPSHGQISLPLMPDYLDRPRQIVNQEQGKEAITEYECLGVEKTKEGYAAYQHYRLALFPKTGRTHQLRVHCAHREGLNAPILGDPLYGNEPANRLYLHAEFLQFEHPLTGKEMSFERKADF